MWMNNNVDPDQLASSEVSWSGSTFEQRESSFKNI